ncbi:SUKH superfamily protein [Cricetibacter osteomyelitidis]|uniref:SUKH superfamily protein n=1 Tax=Cricetibacter osteomyelitidis TaxID=1521931 RepID=A0A4R2T4S0_9PAST|nr:SMI1/KNR4 family protein [Cricetibacter osteomyelitidis]TCP92058.1 SUKH superfamily protein [Cricetibacter osteomyelitidis]
MRNSFTPYSNKILPKGFSFPKEYIELSKNLSYVNSIQYFNWWFEDYREDIEQHISILQKLTGKENLISFARDLDWAACFDLTDHSGDPKVYVYDLGNRENHYVVNNFDEWLQGEINKAKE